MSKRKTKIIEDLVTQDEIVSQFKAIKSKSDIIINLQMLGKKILFQNLK